jgi:crotonobetainyl-CoA:carnitine CoA-transferase CaiB-like acyl-CoA transferase
VREPQAGEPTGNGVMTGIRILEVAEHTFVPAAAAILSDWGADVIKIEHVERGDAMRGLLTTAGVDLGGTAVNLLMEHANRGKRSIGVDLSTPDGVDLVYRLAASSDVFLTNKLSAVRTKLRIDVDDIRAHNPKIVYVRGSGYGVRGPDADLGGYDSLAYWARAGNAASAKAPEIDYVPQQPAPALGDSIGAMTIAGGIAAALLHRERTGEARVVDVSLLAAGMWAMGLGITISQQTGAPWATQSPRQPGPRNPLTGIYRTSDDRWISLSMLQGFAYWPGACMALGLPELVDDPRFATHELLMANGEEAASLIAAVLATRPLAEWDARLRTQKGQWSPVQDSVQVADDPMVVANGYLQQVSTYDGTPATLVTTPVQFDEAPSPPGRCPAFNEHGDAILRDELGLDDEAILELKIKGIVV